MSDRVLYLKFSLVALRVIGVMAIGWAFCVAVMSL